MDTIKIKNSKRKVNEINGCRILARSTEALGFSSHLIKLNENNMIGFEFGWASQIRIDAIVSDSHESFVQMMNVLILVAKSLGYTKLSYADHISKEALEWMIEYGFSKVKVVSDPYNKYLELFLKERK